MAYHSEHQNGTEYDFWGDKEHPIWGDKEHPNCAWEGAASQVTQSPRSAWLVSGRETCLAKSLPKTVAKAGYKAGSHDCDSTKPAPDAQGVVYPFWQPESPVLARYKADFTALQSRHQVFNHVVCHIVAALFALDSAALLAKHRSSSKTSFARHIAMYICHVTGQQTQHQLALFFARDRKTISYACAAIEDLREDPVFDADLERLEAFMARIKNDLADLAAHGPS